MAMKRLKPEGLPPILEKAFQSQVIDLAKLFGWRVNHQRPAMSKNGRWITATQGHTGFPDLVLAHLERQMVIFAELKSEAGRLTPEQEEWASVLIDCPGLYRCWRPSDWLEIERILRGSTGDPDDVESYLGIQRRG
jgi:hypothetical protein